MTRDLPPSNGAQYINDKTDDLLTFVDRDENEHEDVYLFSRTDMDTPLEVPASYWYDGTADFIQEI